MHTDTALGWNAQMTRPVELSQSNAFSNSAQTVAEVGAMRRQKTLIAATPTQLIINADINKQSH